MGWLFDFILFNEFLAYTIRISTTFSLNCIRLIVGREVEGFVLEAKGGDKVTEECRSFPRGYEFTSTGTYGEADFRTQAG